MYSQKKKLSGLSPSFHIHVSMSDLYFPRTDPHIFLEQNKQTNRGNIYIIHRHKNVEIGTEAGQFLFFKYLFQIFGIVSLQCSVDQIHVSAKSHLNTARPHACIN